MENVSAKMVGMYYCVNQQSYYNNRHLTLDRLVKMRQASRIYIYVNDPAHPLVPIDGIVFKVYRGDFFVSPCKPTLPIVDVEFYRTNEGDGTQLNESIESNIRSGPLKVVRTKGAEHMFTMSGELIIENLIRANTGRYWCIVEDQNGNEKNSTFKVHVRHSSENFVILREKSNRSRINVHRSGPLDIVFECRSSPVNITYLWMNNSGKEITAEKDGKYELSHTDMHVKLRINDPNVNDTGNYTLRVTAGTVSIQQQIEVYVYAKPVVQIEQSTEGKFMRMGDKVSFTCRATGFPCPEISLQFWQCKILQNCSIGDMTSSSWHPSNGTDETCINNSGVLILDATAAGVVYCSARNSEGNDTTQLLVSGPISGITMEIDPNEIITVGDHVAIVCSADVFNYKNEINFKHNDKVLQQSDGVQISYPNNYYAWQARIDIESVQHKHDGEIYCQVKTISDTFDTREINLHVIDPAKPRLVSGKSNETLAVELTRALRLDCDVVGTPDPTISWLKNGSSLVLDAGSNRVQLNRTTLAFEFLREKDLGIYACRAENKMGSIEKYWKVEVQEVEVRKVE
uniref:Ig-like domain-containing protein n=1 Tax=Anopheles dirus TaxID=7168 RepID=A0A182NT47_9DIPT